MVSTWDLSNKFGISGRAVQRILDSAGLTHEVIRCCAYWPTEEAMKILESLPKSRLDRLRKGREKNAHAAPPGYVMPYELVDLFPEFDLAFVSRSLGQSDVSRAQVRKHYAYRKDEAVEHLERVRRRKIMQEQIDHMNRLNRESARKKDPPKPVELKEKPLYKMPPLEDFRRVAEEFRRTNPWR